jgi:serine/threonine protein kinase
MKKTTFNDFEFLRTLGKGAFSTVYLVRRKLNHKQYALKSIIMEKLKETEQQNSVNEIRLLASISHPNIIGYKEAFWNEKNKTLNIVMEYCDDGDLETKIKIMKRNKQRFEEPLIWNYAIQIIKGLKSLHDKKILHRDLKSANIFLTKEKQECKIGDLNVSKVMKDKYLVNTQIGTPTYSSPEVWQNKPYSYKSDLWSVGCIIYEMCCLRPPFKGKNFEELCENVCHGKIEKISSRYSEELWNLIKMLLEVDAKKRVDCDTILKSKIIKEKMDELSEIYKDNNPFYIHDDDSSMLDTIEYKNLRDLEKKIPNKNNYGTSTKHLAKILIKNIETGDETIKNDSSFDECSISEQRPSNNIIKKNSNINPNNMVFSRNGFNSKDFIQRIKREDTFQYPLNLHHKGKSYDFFDINFILSDELLHLKISKSQKNINNKLKESILNSKKKRKKNFTRILNKNNNKKAKEKNEKEKNKSNNFNIIMFPNNKIVKSGLMSLKEDIARKKSQQNLPITTLTKKANEVNIHQTSNSNPKFIKKNIHKKDSSNKVKLNDSINKKYIRHSLFDLNEQQIKKEKEKAKHANINEKKNNIDNTYNDIKIKYIEPSKFAGNNKRINKTKRNMMIRKYKIDINDHFTTKDKNNNTEINININENAHLNKIKNLIKNNKEKNNSKNITFDEKILKKTVRSVNSLNSLKSVKSMKSSEKSVNSYLNNCSENLPVISSKFKNMKSNKCLVQNLKSSKIIEIDISNNHSNKISLKNKNQITRNPFNSEKKHCNTNFLTNSLDLKKNCYNMNKPKLSSKNNYYYNIEN